MYMLLISDTSLLYQPRVVRSMKPICNGTKGILDFSRNVVDGVVGMFCGSPARKQKSFNPGKQKSFNPGTNNDIIPGGLASGLSSGNVIEACVRKGFPVKQVEWELNKGIEVEMEHVIGMKDKEMATAIATEIAKDHITEHCNYYAGLEIMERKLDNNNNNDQYVF